MADSSTAGRRTALARTTARLARAAALAAAAGVCAIAPLTAGSPSPGAVDSTGSIRGIVGLTGTATYSGPSPAGTPIDMTGDDYCGPANAGREVIQRPIVTDAQGRLANVVVHISQGVPPGDHPVPSEPALLDQENCLYTPHVVAMRTSQPLVIRNSDQTLHNVHVRAGNNREFNLGQPIRGMESRRTFDNAEIGIDVACDIHGWMNASIAVFDHPFFALSAEDGSFAIDAVPAGEYVLEAWHETLGTLRQTVTVSAGEAAEVTFTFEGG